MSTALASPSPRLHIFVMRLPYSGRAVHVAYPNEARESFLDGHNIAFEPFGGIQSTMIR